MPAEKAQIDIDEVAEALLYVPAAHLGHDEEPIALVPSPAGHVVTFATLALANGDLKPEGASVQEAAPREAYEPLGQGRQALESVAPAFGLYVPGGQAEQEAPEEETEDWNQPSGHG